MDDPALARRTPQGASGGIGQIVVRTTTMIDLVVTAGQGTAFERTKLIHEAIGVDEADPASRESRQDFEVEIALTELQSTSRLLHFESSLMTKPAA
jgi:hypothetical protein